MSRVSPDDLRSLAHMLETDVGIVALCEALEAGTLDKAQAASQVRETVERAGVRHNDVVWLGSLLLLMGKQMESEADLIVRAHEGMPEPYGADHVAEIKPLRR